MIRRVWLSNKTSRRLYHVLAIESSCDDSCVALLDRKNLNSAPQIIDEEKLTLNSAHVGGIIPTAAHEFHQTSIANLVGRFCRKHDLTGDSVDLICVTRGPGMVGSLSASMQFAKGLAVAWNTPLIGVHHMLGHLLTAMLPSKERPTATFPNYPFLSLLCSGGHTMLVLLRSLTDHRVIINTSDIAAGDSIDKCARELGMVGNMLGPELEKYVGNISDSDRSEFESINTNTSGNKFGLRLRMPMRGPKHKKVPDTIEFGFASFLSSISGYKDSQFGNGPIDEHTRQLLAYKLQDVLFDHIVNRINVAFFKHGLQGDNIFEGVQDFVCSGGVVANKVLRQKLFHNLKSEEPLRFHFPDLRLCTDNATMIGNAGIHIFETLRVKSNLDILPIQKWPMDKLLDVDGWETVTDEEFQHVTGMKPCK